ncbi:MAG: beta-hydroxyacyl-ACP dehydratase [Spirochaetes bacterium RIFOXYC1_FULL_54_7]|nr:MAG: beta-hydroxyacyl-ACP dehydratase [Spirochaetes bacterium RIFOXYC1_FULL_54_7]
MKADRSKIEEILPHRDPFLFIDETTVEDDGTIHARRLWKGDEFFFAGHFPKYPVVPGVILVETMAQAGGIGAKLAGLAQDGLFFLATINNVKFRRQVSPGDRFDIKVTNLRTSARLIKQKGEGFVNGELAVEADWLCIAGEK